MGDKPDLYSTVIIRWDLLSLRSHTGTSAVGYELCFKDITSINHTDQPRVIRRVLLYSDGGHYSNKYNNRSLAPLHASSYIIYAYSKSGG